MLFDEVARSDPEPARSEDSFTFLNRVAGPYWERVRGFVEGLFSDFPPEHAAGLRSRFRDRRWNEHVGAWWELYLFGLLRALGGQVQAHPPVPDASSRPDFRVRLETDDFFLEARYVQAGLTAERRQGRDDWITAPLDELTHPRFMVSARITQRGESQPRKREVIDGVIEWLDSIDADSAAGLDVADLPKHYGVAGGWRFELIPLPMRSATGARRLVGVYPGISGWDNSREALRRALREKAGRYGQLGRPYVIALLTTSGFLAEDDVAAMVYGSQTGRNGGVWDRRATQRHTRVSAVMVADALLPWSVGDRLPRIWVNPAPAHPLTSYMGLPTAVRLENGRVVLEDGRLSPRGLFGLPADWPGPDPRFSR